MKFNKSAVISLIVITVTFLLCIIFRAVPVSRIWNSYSVVYVEKSLPENRVLSYFDKFSVDGVISMGQQKVPFVSDFTPIMPQSVSTYLTDRLSYFYDYSESYRLYYVPRGNDSASVRILEEIVKDTNTPCGIDGKQQYPWLVPLIVVFVYGIFIFLSKNRVAFALASLSIVVLSFSQVFYPVAAASILYMLSCYLASRLWQRRKAVPVLKKNVFVIIPAMVSVLSIMILSVQCAVLVLLCCATSICFLILYSIWQAYVDSRITFKFVRIFSAQQLPVMHPKTSRHTLLCLVPLVVILVVYLLTSRISSASSGSGISIPVPVSSQIVDEGSERILPSVNDYYEWLWKAKTFAYRNLNEHNDGSVIEGESVVVPRYEMKDDQIVESYSSVMTYDSDFRQSADKEIDALEYNAVEKLIKKQGSDVSVVYRNSSDSRGTTDGLGLILILVCLFVPVLLLLIYVLKSGRKYR